MQAHLSAKRKTSLPIGICLGKHRRHKSPKSPGQPLTPHPANTQSQSPLLAPAGHSAAPLLWSLLTLLPPFADIGSSLKPLHNCFFLDILNLSYFYPICEKKRLQHKPICFGSAASPADPMTPSPGCCKCFLFIWGCSWALTHVLSQTHQECASPPKGLFQGELPEPHAYNIAERGLSGFSLCV